MKKRKSFKHSSSLRNENAMVRLRIALGPAGYGIYFMLVEKLYQTGSPIDAEQLDILAYEFHCTLEQISAVVNDFGLFILTEEGYILPEMLEPTPVEPSADITTEVESTATEAEHDPEFASLPIKAQIKQTMAKRATYEQLLHAAADDKPFLKQITASLIAEGKSFPSVSALITAVRDFIPAIIL